jgi:succinate dehydrogenase / fumarate reductase cytochrome b subunit
MVADAFSRGGIAILYVVAMVGLFLHLSHGIQSTFQSLGLNNPKTMPGFTTGGKLLSVLFLVGYGSIPVLFLVGLLAK